MSLHPPHREAAELWLAEEPDPQTASELRALIERYDRGDHTAMRELHEAFHGRLEFGTAGLRGLLGPGPQRMNRVLVRQVTAGLAAYLVAHVRDVTRGVVIGYDGRHNSRIFAEDTGRVLAGAGIVAFVAHRAWPTPTTAWAVVGPGHLGAAHRRSADRETAGTPRRVVRRLLSGVPTRPRRCARRCDDNAPDFVERPDGQLIAIEIKAAAAPTEADTKHLSWFKTTLGPTVAAAVLFHSGPRVFRMLNDVWTLPTSCLWGR